MHILEAALIANLAPQLRSRVRAAGRRRWPRPCELVRFTTAFALLLPLAVLLSR